MIMLCERCCAPIDDREPVVRLAHIDSAQPDGSVSPPRTAPHDRPDTGAWDPTRGIGSRRP